MTFPSNIITNLVGEFSLLSLSLPSQLLPTPSLSLSLLIVPSPFFSPQYLSPLLMVSPPPPSLFWQPLYHLFLLSSTRGLPFHLFYYFVWTLFLRYSSSVSSCFIPLSTSVFMFLQVSLSLGKNGAQMRNVFISSLFSHWNVRELSQDSFLQYAEHNRKQFSKILILCSI